MKLTRLCLCFLLALTKLATASVNIVAAENFYGGVAEQIGGSSVQVVSILTHPNQDPHEFQADVATAKVIANADIVIFNGIGYDDWMERLLAVTGKTHRVVIKVADLIGAKAGENPHLWYHPKTISALATKIAQVLHQPQAGALFHQSLQPLFDKIAALKKKTSGIKVTATEPLFGYMATALGFEMLNDNYQIAVMNDTDPNFTQTANFEKSLTNKTVKILFYNSQVTAPSTQRMQSIAKKHGIPIVGVTETQPTDTKSYVEWMLSELSVVEKALEVF
jgi:zinc/manganese transport system substrate-binding protein